MTKNNWFELKHQFKSRSENWLERFALRWHRACLKHLSQLAVHFNDSVMCLVEVTAFLSVSLWQLKHDFHFVGWSLLWLVMQSILCCRLRSCSYFTPSSLSPALAAAAAVKRAPSTSRILDQGSTRRNSLTPGPPPSPQTQPECVKKVASSTLEVNRIIWFLFWPQASLFFPQKKRRKRRGVSICQNTGSCVSNFILRQSTGKEQKNFSN